MFKYYLAGLICDWADMQQRRHLLGVIISWLLRKLILKHLHSDAGPQTTESTTALISENTRLFRLKVSMWCSHYFIVSSDKPVHRGSLSWSSPGLIPARGAVAARRLLSLFQTALRVPPPTCVRIAVSPHFARRCYAADLKRTWGYMKQAH